MGNNLNGEKDRKQNPYWVAGWQHSQMEDDYSEESNPDSIYVTEDGGLNGDAYLIGDENG